ncbi:phosphatidylinositol alpha-1,6-mannosyltransferase [Marinobacter antarcticus]|uniref:Phosphatidylinositol alpha-1,6-mannosyltransferase n=2 Tax=Marinobacter antarcticus TaxID=564117 RepID=A0A1M6SMX7_9GAMM|nr:phosphatidylinositol alpha-1,6-mannosyltransferase [Marinobacter antarcticus]
MRKILLLSEIFPPTHGGSGRWFWEIYKRFPSGSVQVLTDQHSDGEPPDNQFPHRVDRSTLRSPYWGIASFKGLGFYIRLWRKVDQLTHAHSIEQVHCGRVIPEGLPALFNKLRRGIPYTCYVHGEDVEVARTSREISMLTRWVMNHAEKVIANSENTAQILRSWWGLEDQLVTMTPGVDVDWFRPALSQTQNRWPDRRTILTVGRLQKRKGQDMMIRALPKIRDQFPCVHYCIIGGGQEEEALRELAAELDVSDLVEFAGELSDLEMLECYQQCDLFALPNRRVKNDDEGFGMVLLEAQSCGTPVLAGDAGGTGETLVPEKTGVIVDCTDPEPLANAVNDLLSDTSRLKNMGTAGRFHMEGNFSWDKLAARAIELLQ